MGVEQVWYKLSIPLKDHDRDVIIAWLDYHEIDSVTELDNSLEAYTSREKLEDIVNMLEEKFQISEPGLRLSTVEYENWNAIWEANFEPIHIDNIYIRAPFHEAPKSEAIDIVIQPKMAFGTGHHETTFMMIEYMNKINMEGKKILDYGCGTGILSLFALMKNASHLTAIDIQKEAIENTIENVSINPVDNSKIDIIEGDLEDVKKLIFDLVIANINRTVLMRQSKTLSSLIPTDGSIICSGILNTDLELILTEYQEFGLKPTFVNSKGDWSLIAFNKIV